MALFDSIIDEARKKFNLGDKAEILFPALLALMTDKAGGGFTGFLQRFTDAGLDDTASSWVNSGTNTPISNEQVESALGEDLLNDISRNVGLDYKTTTSASAFMIPRIVDELTPEGVAPAENDLPAKIGGYLRNVGGTTVGETFDRIGTAATATIDRENSVVAGNFETIDGNDNNSALNWLLPLVILGLLIIAGFMFCSKSEPIVNTVNTNPATLSVNSNTVVNADR